MNTGAFASDILFIEYHKKYSGAIRRIQLFRLFNREELPVGDEWTIIEEKIQEKHLCLKTEITERKIILNIIL